MGLLALFAGCTTTPSPKTQSDHWREYFKKHGWLKNDDADKGKNESERETPQNEPPPAQPPQPTPPPPPAQPYQPKLPDLSQLPQLTDLLNPEILKKRFPDLWQKMQKQYPNLPLEKLLPKVPEALQKESFEPLIEAYCSDKFPDKGGWGYKGCMLAGKGLAKQECAKAKGKVEEACKKFGKVCEDQRVKEAIEKVLKACEKAAN